MFLPNPLAFFKQKINPSYLGVDIGTTSIKAVEVDLDKQRRRVVNYGVLESKGALVRENAALQSSELKIFEQEAADFLKALIKKMNTKTNVVVGTLPVFSAFTTTLKLPRMSDKDLQKAIAFQAKQYTPLPLSEVALDWIKIADYTDNEGNELTQALLLSIPKEYVQKIQSIYKRAGLALQSLEVESLSLVRALIGSDPTPTFIVDIGARSTAILISEGGKLKYSSQTDIAGDSITHSLATSLQINPVRAEALKREKGITASGPNYELSTIMTSILDAIISEVRRVDHSYRSQFPESQKMERIILTGGGANLVGIRKYFQGELKMPTVRAVPFSNFTYPTIIEPTLIEINPLFSVSLGAVMREMK